MSAYTFTHDSITCAGRTMQAGYSVTLSGAVMVFVTIDTPAGGAQKVRIREAVEGSPADLSTILTPEAFAAMLAEA